ncbi:MAG: metallophosphoesterase [Rhodospirillales bacterium]|jgi:serine/threonine protein phosphatase 1
MAGFMSTQINITSGDWQRAPQPVSKPLFAIGDIHGDARKLEALQRHLRERAATGSLVYLGDLIDPSSKMSHYDCARVLDLVAAGVGNDGLAETTLIGNHDQFLMLALDAARNGKATPFENYTWLEQGALLTAAAWGIGKMTDERELASAIWNAMSPAQRSVFDNMKTYAEHEAYLLVHAGFCDYLSLSEQLEAEWRSFYPRTAREEMEHPFWMRLYNEDYAPKGRVLIVGHTARKEAFIGARHIGIDTGVKYGGPLTALEIVGDRLRTIQATEAA